MRNQGEHGARAQATWAEPSLVRRGGSCGNNRRDDVGQPNVNTMSSKPPRTPKGGKELHGLQSTKAYAWMRRRKRHGQGEEEGGKSQAGRPPSRPRPAPRPGSNPRRPASQPAQAGPQAGLEPEAAGLPAGPGRPPGRAASRRCRPPCRPPSRPPGRPRPVPRPATHRSRPASQPA